MSANVCREIWCCLASEPHHTWVKLLTKRNKVLDFPESIVDGRTPRFFFMKISSLKPSLGTAFEPAHYIPTSLAEY
jgi:hypothetical protein